MPTPASGADLPDYLSFVDTAVTRTTRELPEVDPVAMRLVLSLHRVTSALIYDLESTVHRPRGWSWAGFRVLFALWLNGPGEAKQIATLAGMSRAALSALVTTLARDGLLTKTPSESDRRAVQLALTEAGHEAITSTYAQHNLREQRWVRQLSRPEQTVLIGLLEKLMAGANDDDISRRS